MEEQLINRQLAEMITKEAGLWKHWPRVSQVLEARLRGATFRQIGEDMGVSPERAKHMYDVSIRCCRNAAARLGLKKRRK
jgi:hypothetical protein